MPPTFEIDAERVQKAVVKIEAPSREAITDEVIAAALDRLPDRDWRTEDYGVLPPSQVSGGMTLHARAAEIGISIPTINRWKAAGVAVFNDDAVREHIGKQRKHSFKIAPKFKARLNG